MHIDARELENNSLIEGDICIVGAGVAGISIALDWMDTPYKVVLLEGGGFEYDQKVQELYHGKLTGQPYYPIESARLHYFGGTSGHWGGMCSIMDDIDFVKRDWVENSGWPISFKDIDPYYKRAHPNLDLGPYDYSLKNWLDFNPNLKPLPLDENVIWNKMWKFSPPTRFGTKYKDVIVGAKNIHLYTYANVIDIKATDNISQIKGLTVKNYAGKTHTVKARYFILACCSIQNSRLLLASNSQASTGLGNDNDLVGRYFMEHPELHSGELWLINPDSMKLYERNSLIPRAELAVSAKTQEKYKILNGTASLMPLTIAEGLSPNVKIWNKEDPRESLDTFNHSGKKVQNGNFFDRVSHKLFHTTSSYRSFDLYTRIEQLPNPQSRVVLDKEKDSLGVPRANLHWAMSPIDKRTVRKIIEIIGQQVGIAGIGRVKINDFLLDETNTSMPDFTSGGWHHMGTTRMNDDPKKGVVDADCKIHGINNLFIAGSSCFPTGGAVNPTLTLTALSLRLSDHLKERIKE